MIEYSEEHANEALLVITLDSKVLAGLAQHYSSVIESLHCPSDLQKQ